MFTSGSRLLGGSGLVLESVTWLHGGVPPHWPRASNSDSSVVSYPGRGGCTVTLKCHQSDLLGLLDAGLKIDVSKDDQTNSSRPGLVLFQRKTKLCKAAASSVYSEEKVTGAANVLRLQLLRSPRREDGSCLAQPQAEKPLSCFFLSSSLRLSPSPTGLVRLSLTPPPRCGVFVRLRSLRLQVVGGTAVPSAAN